MPSSALALRIAAPPAEPFRYGAAELHLDDCLAWLNRRAKNSVHAVVTDPPYGLVEYTEAQQVKLRKGEGGVWRLPPKFDGCQRAPMPRFTVLKPDELDEIDRFFREWAEALLPALVPGAHVFVASNYLLSHRVSVAMEKAGLERRGAVIRLVQTMRGGDRPKNAHQEFPDVCVMPRGKWEPWLLFRKPFAGRVQDNLREWGTGGLRRVSESEPFGDVIPSHPTRRVERDMAPHPSLKPQAFLRQLVRAALPLGRGVVLDCFAGAGSTLAAAESVGYQSVGVERDPAYHRLAVDAIPKLAALAVG